uniref:Ig-like domain-containing protein n=1 Tax=Xiphophorus couchianus TaxID=32473 RepID=A0A3B5L1W0_9TELE
LMNYNRIISLLLQHCFSFPNQESTVPGQNVSLPCRLPNNKPAVVVQWTRPDLEPEDVFLFRDEQPDPENQHPFFRNRVELQDRRMKDGDVSLLLSNVTTNDSGKYECRVFQREATGRKKRALTSDPIGIIFLDVAPPTGEFSWFLYSSERRKYEVKASQSKQQTASAQAALPPDCCRGSSGPVQLVNVLVAAVHVEALKTLVPLFLHMLVDILFPHV